MADASPEERTESPTPRRIEQAHRSGQIAISRDLAAALAMATACGVLIATAQAATAQLVLAMREALMGTTKSLSISEAARTGFELAAVMLALPLGALWLMACLAALAQTRGRVTARPLRPEAQRMLPSLGRVFGHDRMIEAGKGVLSVALLFSVAYWSIRPAISAIAGLGGTSAGQALRVLGIVGRRLGIHLSLAMLALGIVDYFWQRHRHGKALLMSRDEVKREHRELEGEPAHKAERRRLHRETMQEQALCDVPRADFVVVQSGIMAVAVRHESDGSQAPVVLVKGERKVAQAIEDAARTAHVPVFADPDLARALMAAEDGDEIPEALYEQVAEWLVRARTLSQLSH